ncbi:MAG TPA: type II secretion system F family protein [Gaiellaceae bacterium]|nr:type II secretion system F family protein [Gaiellaceae bacterium]
MLIVASACLAGAVFVVGQLVTAPERERRSLVRRAASYGTVRLPGSREERLSLKERVVGPLATRLAGFVLRMNRRENLEQVQQRLLAAGLSGVAPRSFVAAKGALAAGGGGLGLILLLATRSTTGFLLMVGLAAGGYIAPGYVVGMKARRRRDLVQAALPDALDLLAVSVEAGLGFDAAISKLTENMEGPLIDEFGLALSEMRVGEARADALKKLSARVDSPELSAFVRAIIQADQLGISLGRILRVQAVDTRLKRQAAAEEKAMKAPIKMLFPTVMFIFPAMFIVVLGPALISLTKLFSF